MNISFSNNISTSFKGSYTDRFFDNPEDIKEDHRIIKEYEGIPEKSEEDTIFVNDMLREDELFDRRRDFVDSGYRKYDTDDLPLSQNIIYRNLNKDLVNKSQFIESGHSSSRGLSWNLIPVIPFYTVENSWAKEHESFQERLNQGYKRSDISNIYHFSLIDTGVEGPKKMDINLAKAGFKLLDSGKSIYQTADIMDKSKIHYANGSTRFNKELLNFLTVFPDSREYVVEPDWNHERVRTDIIKIFGELNEVCPEHYDKVSVIKACQTGVRGNKKINENMFDRCVAGIKSGIPVTKCTNAVRDAQLDKEEYDGEFNEELFKFSLKNPYSRHFVVIKRNHHEYFSPERAKMYTAIKRKCEDKYDVGKIMAACELGDYYGKYIDEDLYNLSLKLLEKDPKWTNEHARIMDTVVKEKYNERSINTAKFNLANAMAKGDYSVGSIYAAVVLNHKNTELSK